MKNISIIGVIFLSFFASTIAKAEELNTKADSIACEKLGFNIFFHYSFLPPYFAKLSYQLFTTDNNEDTSHLIADSLWITKDVDGDSVVMIIKDPTERYFDVLSLERSHYYLWATYGKCIRKREFYKRVKETSPGVAEECLKFTALAKNIYPRKAVVSVMDTSLNQPVAWDSVWFTWRSWRTNPEILLTASRQHGDTIDIAPMVGTDAKDYVCWVQIGECVIATYFYYVGAAYEPCMNYQEVYSPVSYNGGELWYSIINPNNIELPAIDSVWIKKDHYSDILFASHAKPDEIIDISSLSRGYWILCIPFGECVRETVFYAEGQSDEQGVDKVIPTAPAVKILRDGHLYIKRGEKEYTITGQEVR